MSKKQRGHRKASNPKHRPKRKGNKITRTVFSAFRR